MQKRLGHIDYSSKPYKYFDMNGEEIKEGDTIVYYEIDKDENLIKTDHTEKIYLLSDECSLGTDATNKSWVESGKASPCEYGCYPLEMGDLNSCAVVK